jgi:hypothetical protein
MRPLLIEIQRLKQYSVVNNNLDAKLIEPTIVMCQDLHLQSILGTDLYEEICNQITTATVTALNQTLLNDYIEPYLTNLVISEGLIDWHIKITNTDVINAATLNATSENPSGVFSIQNKYRSIADNYANTLYLYLISNTANYPLYLNGNLERWKVRPKSFEFTGAFYTGNSRTDPRDRFKRNRRYK